MITRNFDNLMKGLCIGTTAFSPSTFTETDWQNGAPFIVKNKDGSMLCVTDFSNFKNYGLLGTFTASSENKVDTSTFPVMVLGSNDAEETYDDYTMSTLTTLSVVDGRACTVTYDAEKATLTTTKIFINNTAEDITVKEVGIFSYFLSKKSGSSSSVSAYPLLCREKLAEPVILTANGGQATFSLSIEIPSANKPN